MKIRKGTPQDIDELAELYDNLIDYLVHHINYPGWMKGIYPTREDAEQGIRENALFVATENNRIIGTVILRHKPEEAYHSVDWHNNYEYKEIFVVYTFAVHPAYLNQGVGRAIMHFIFEYALQHKIKAIRLDVYEKNIPAIRLYENTGFQYIDTVDLGYSNYGLDHFKLYQKLL